MTGVPTDGVGGKARSARLCHKGGGVSVVLYPNTRALRGRPGRGGGGGHRNSGLACIGQPNYIQQTAHRGRFMARDVRTETFLLGSDLRVPRKRLGYDVRF